MRFPKWLKRIWYWPDDGPEGMYHVSWNPSESGFPPGTFDPPSQWPVPPQPIRPAAFSPRHSYGGQGTIHRTTHIDVEVDPETRQVTAVWFRCLNLPFQVFERPSTAHINPKGIAIEEITYVDLPHEGSDL